MKRSAVAFLALWSVDTSLAFVPQSIASLSTPSLASTADRSSPTICFASTVGSSSSNNVGGRTSFPYDDDAIRFAYDEWRLIYGKGDFDRYRFENFKTNYKTLTMANIQARDKALQQGQPAPQWMSLNEYGDYSVAEYEAMLEGRLIGECLNDDNAASPNQMMNSKNNGYVNRDSSYINSSYQYNNGINGGEEQQDQYGRPIRSTQVVQPGGGRAGGTQVISSGGAPRGTQVISSSSYSSLGLQSQAEQPPTTYNPSMTYGGYGGEEYQDQFGRTIRPTQVLQSSIPDAQQQLSSGSSNSFGTQVISSSSSSYSSGRGGFRGTQVMQPAASASTGTQVGRSDRPASSFTYGTQVVNPAGTTSGRQGTRVIQPADNYKTDKGTLVINKDDDRQAWSQYSNNLPDTDGGQRNTVSKRGTMVIKRQIPEPEPMFNPFDLFGSKSSEKRETVQIDPKPKDEKGENGGLFNMFGGKKDEEAVKGTQTIVQQEKTEEKEKASIFSFFSGKPKTDDSRPVRGTIILPNTAKNKKVTKEIEDKRRKTVLIPKKANENGLPSILSFFGGAKKVSEEDAVRNPNARPTLLIKKPQKKTPSWSLFSSPSKKTEDIPKTEDGANSSSSATNKNARIEAQLAKQREAIENAAKRKEKLIQEREAQRKEVLQKREEATKRRVEQAQGKSIQKRNPIITALGQPILSQTKKVEQGQKSPTIKPPVTKPRLSFFGSTQVPEVRRWRQNFDGSITGFIYNSRNFEDGTRVTTSPVPRGAKKGTTVTTTGGTKYFLQ